jgi:hypothetical protein
VIPNSFQADCLKVIKDYAYEVAIDTAQVTACFVQTYPKADVLPYLEALARAGQALRDVESTPGFMWEKQSKDFESCCQELAEAVYDHPSRKHFVPVVKAILYLP